MGTTSRARRRRRRPLLRALNIQIDRFRIWYKITYERGRVLATEGDAWQSLDAPGHFEDPGRFYHADGIVPRVSGRVVGRIRGAEITRFAFPSLHPMRFPETNLAVGRFYRNVHAPAAPVVLVSHGWAHRTLRTIEHLYVRPFLRAGFSVAFVMHPLHFERTPRGAYSGELVVSADVVLTVEAFRQGVIDMIGAANWLRATGRGRIGLFGYSLGAYLAGLMAAVRGDWEFTVLGGVGDSPVSPILDTPLGRNIREDLRACGMLDREKVTRCWRIISPAAFRPKVPKDRILLLAGRFDRIMLPASARRLWNAWDRPRLVWLDRGHYGLLATNRGLMARAIPFMKGVVGRG
ncbi:MAG: alpha/beta hydrolase family protein [Acidobacteriota bacterium]